MSYTKGPWRFQMLGSEGGRIYPDYGDIRERGKFIAIVNGRSTQEDQANGDFIVKAVNVHHELVEALDSLIAYAKLALNEITDQDTGWYYQLQGAIQKGDKVLTNAKGGQA